MVDFAEPIFQKIHEMSNRNSAVDDGLRFTGRELLVVYPNKPLPERLSDGKDYMEISVSPVTSSRLESIGSPKLWRRTGMLAIYFYYHADKVSSDEALSLSQRWAEEFEKWKGEGTALINSAFSFSGNNRVSPTGNDTIRNNRYVVAAELRFNYTVIES